MRLSDVHPCHFRVFPMNAVFTLPNLSCNHCVASVTRAIRAIDPDASIDVDLPAKRVSIDSDCDTPTLAHALDEAGYPPAR